MAEKFIEHIVQQQIFVTPPYIDAAPFSTSNHLQVKNNTFIFNAIGSIIRFTNIHQNSSNYRLLSTGDDLFEIKQILLNSSQTLLAVLGYNSELSILIIPESLNLLDHKPYVVKSYKINVVSSIKKILWNPLISSDSTLVILTNNNEIISYDLTISISKPQLTVNLLEFQNFSGDSTSITFGSSSSILGGLTLYVSTKSSIFAINPFIHHNSKLALTSNQVTSGLEESSQIFNLIEEKFPSKSLISSLDSYLKVSAIRQYEFFKNLNSQLQNVLPTEARRNRSDDLFIFTQNLSSTFKPTLQGPIYNKSNIQDIQSVFTNEKIVILAALFEENGYLNLSFDIQLKPLIMMWTQMGDTFENPFIRQELPEIPKPVTKSSKYIKPRRGFGFVELTPVAPVVSINTVDQENKFWKLELSQIDPLGVDILPVKMSKNASTSVYEDLLQQFIVKVDDSIILVDSKSWIDKLLYNLSYEEEINVSVLNEYKLLIESKGNQSGLIFVRDILTNSGDFFIQTNTSKTDNLQVITLQSKKENKKSEKLLEAEKANNEISFQSVSLNDLKDVKPLTGFKTKGFLLDVDSLGEVNEISNQVVKQVSVYNTTIIKITLILTSQIENLHEQLRILDSFEPYDEEKRKKVVTKIEEVRKRQEEIDSRFEKVFNKLLNSLRKEISSKELPLSNEEKAWFKEINSISSELLEKDEGSLVNKVKSLKAQADVFWKGEEEVYGKLYSESVDFLKSKNKLAKLKDWLEREGELIEKVKEQQKQNLIVLNNV